MCHFASCSHKKTALIYIFFYFWTFWFGFHQYFNVLCPYFEIGSQFSLFVRGTYVFLCFDCVRELIMPYRDCVREVIYVLKM